MIEVLSLVRQEQNKTAACHWEPFTPHSILLICKPANVLGLNFNLGCLPSGTVNSLKVDRALSLIPSGASSVKVSVWHMTGVW